MMGAKKYNKQAIASFWNQKGMKEKP